MSRQLIYSTINALYPGAVFTNNIVDTPPVDLRPFIVLDWQTVTPGPHQEAPSHVQLLDVWVHDAKGSYIEIDNIISAIRTALTSIFANVVGVGKAITCIEWTGDGADSLDEGFDTIFRTSSFRVVGSGR